MGTVMIVQNHRAAGETIWRSIGWFWLVVWAVAVVTAASLHLASVPCGLPLYWVAGYVLLAVFWIFTCAIPHAKYLHSRAFEASWRDSWAKPLAFGVAGWIVIAVVFLLTR
jgi:hypothetical protein